ncbi:sigma 54-interacting transcriptional regulator [Pseudomonas benzopyrenica]|uniref:sigma 54-interacting transcriptional regulator n=1 Tax=Pseudomonas benzopyrenica TaxID=2993566 RepID=UPI0039C0D0DD
MSTSQQLEPHAQQSSSSFDLDEIARNTAPLDVDLLLRGETGTGKDTLARHIHKLSGRSGSFVALNCAAIPESLAESQLFGVTCGAYTGARHSRPGFIEAAHNGTLYLDEIDSMPLPLQAKLLRVLEARGVERLGSTQFIPVNMRVIASAQNSLQRMVEEQRFRRDLYFRLNVVSIKLPALQDRREQIIPLFLEFIRVEACQMGRPLQQPPPCLIHQLLCYHWPGNIRELRSAAKRYVLGLPPLPHIDPRRMDPNRKLKERLADVEKLLIEDCLRRHQHCIDSAITELGIGRRTLYYRMRALNIASAG